MTKIRDLVVAAGDFYRLQAPLVRDFLQGLTSPIGELPALVPRSSDSTRPRLLHRHQAWPLQPGRVSGGGAPGQAGEVAKVPLGVTLTETMKNSDT